MDEARFGMSRDALYFKMRKRGIYGRRYFYPLISSFSPYRDLPSAAPEHLPQAQKMADSVICLPMHHELSTGDVEKVLQTIKSTDL